MDLKEELRKTVKKEFVPREPDFKGNGASVWVYTDKDGKAMLTINNMNKCILTLI